MPSYIERFKERFKSQAEKGEEKQIDYSKKGLANLEIKEPVVVKERNGFPRAISKEKERGTQGI